jgi:hypothetical protein
MAPEARQRVLARISELEAKALDEIVAVRGAAPLLAALSDLQWVEDYLRSLLDRQGAVSG